MVVNNPRYDIYLRDAAYNRIERLDIWEDFTYIKRFNAVGTWSLEVPTSSRISRLITPDTGIIVQRNGITVFSGPGGNSFEENRRSIFASGTDDNVILECPVRPTPTLAQGPYPDEYYVLTGQASSVMITLVNYVIGPSAPIEWKIPQLAYFVDPFLGSTITSRARFDPLIVLLAQLASSPIATGFGFDVIQSDDLTATLWFKIYLPADKREDVTFSVPLHTAEDYKRVHTTPAANYFIIGGGDDFGLNRTLAEGGDAASIAAAGRRIGTFVDRRGVTNPTELEQELAQLIAGTITTESIEITPTEVPSIVYGEHYNLGDVVRAVVKEITYEMLVREIKLDYKPETGPIITPTVADPNASNDEVYAQHLNTVINRLSNIERNFNTPNDSLIEDMLHPTMKWYPGDLKATARSSAQLGWLLCNGDPVSRTTYARLFAAIGTTYGPGNGSTTFNVPDFRDRFPVGKGSSFSVLGATGGSLSVGFAHTHTHSHGLNNHTHSGQSHTHPNTHSHGLTTHDHVMAAHTHSFNNTHDHSITDGPSSDTGRASGGLNVATNFHWHTTSSRNISLDTGTANPTTTDAGLRIDNNASFSGTENDSNVGSASYSGSPSNPSPNSSESDSSAAASPGTFNSIPPYIVINWQIWTGLVPT